MKKLIRKTTLVLSITAFLWSEVRGGVHELDHSIRNLANPPEPPSPSPSPTIPWLEPTIQATSLPRHQSDQIPTDDTATSWQSLPTGAPSSIAHKQCRANEDEIERKKAARCVGVYHHSLATTVSGAAGTLGTPRAFIKRDGTRLVTGSGTYRPVGPNM